MSLCSVLIRAFLPLLHLPRHKLHLQPCLLHVLLNLGDGRKQLRQFVDSGGGFAVVRGEGGGVGAFAQVIYFEVLVAVQVNEAHYVAVLPHLVVRFLYLLAQVGGFVAVFRSGRFGETAVGSGNLDGDVVDVVGAAVDGGHAHDAVLIHLETEEGAVQVLFDDLGGMKVIPYLLVLGILFEGEVAFYPVQFRLLHLQHTVEVGKGLFLFFQFHLLHQAYALATGVERFGIENLDAVYLQFGFAVVSALEGGAGFLKFLTCFLLDVVAGEERAAKAR